MNEVHHEDVGAAFEILLESIESEVNKLNELGGAAFKKGDYGRAKDLADYAEQIAAFRAKAFSLSAEWQKLEVTVTSKTAEPEAKAGKKYEAKLRKGMRTPEPAYYRPILEVLVAMGGSGEMNQVLDKVLPKGSCKNNFQRIGGISTECVNSVAVGA